MSITNILQENVRVIFLNTPYDVAAKSHYHDTNLNAYIQVFEKYFIAIFIEILFMHCVEKIANTIFQNDFECIISRAVC